MTHLDLFSGIGGFALAADRVFGEVEHVFCEIDPFCQAVLKKHWPKATIYGDIKTLTNPDWSWELQPKGSKQDKRGRTGYPFILTGGFPCQPFSIAGQRKGTGDDRYLWPEMFAVIRNMLPEWIIAENVRGLASWNDGMVLETVCANLEGEGYEVQPLVIPACAVNAPHRRDRVWIVAHHTSIDVGRRGWKAAGHNRKRDRKRSHEGRPDWHEDWPTVAARLCTLDDGLPNGLVRPRGWRNAALKAAGNAIVPQVAMQIFQAIKEASNDSNS